MIFWRQWLDNIRQVFGKYINFLLVNSSPCSVMLIYERNVLHFTFVFYGMTAVKALFSFFSSAVIHTTKSIPHAYKILMVRIQQIRDVLSPLLRDYWGKLKACLVSVFYDTGIDKLGVVELVLEFWRMHQRMHQLDIDAWKRRLIAEGASQIQGYGYSAAGFFQPNAKKTGVATRYASSFWRTHIEFESFANFD